MNYVYKTKDILEEMKNNINYIYNNTTNLWTYIGPKTNRRNIKTKMHWLANRFYTVWLTEGNRCSNPKSNSYEWYGLIGIKRIWTSSECINFGINELLKRERWNSWSICRKKDLGNYELGNLELLEKTENCEQIKVTPKRKEQCRLLGKRVGKKHQKISAEKRKKPVKLITCDNSSIFKIFDSLKATDLFIDKYHGFTKKHILKDNNIIINNKNWIAAYITKEEYKFLKNKEE